MIPIAGSSTHFYTVEARRRVGYDSSLPARLVNHAGDEDTRVSASMWTPGMVFEDTRNEIAVSVDAATTTAFAVRIFTGSRPWAVIAC